MPLQPHETKALAIELAAAMPPIDSEHPVTVSVDVLDNYQFEIKMRDDEVSADTMLRISLELARAGSAALAAALEMDQEEDRAHRCKTAGESCLKLSEALEAASEQLRRLTPTA